MSPEYGATCGIFPVDAETLRYLEFTGRPAEQVELVEAYCREQGLFHERGAGSRRYSDTLELDLATVEPSLAGPRRPQDRVALSDAASDFRRSCARSSSGEAYQGWDRLDGHDASRPATRRRARPRASPPKPMPAPPGRRRRRSQGALDGTSGLDHGAVVIAAITSCTNTSNPSVMLGAGLLAKKAVEAGLTRRPWVKTSLAPGLEGRDGVPGARRPDRAARAARVQRSSATAARRASATPARCREEISREIAERDLAVCSVLSGNRNFEGRIHPEVKMNYLASPPLSWPMRWRAGWTSTSRPRAAAGRRVACADIWPTQREVSDAIEHAVESDMFRRSYGEVFEGDENWNGLEVPAGDRYAWDPTRPTSSARRTSTACTPSRRRSFEQITGARRDRAARRQRHHRPHLARPARSRRTRPPAGT